MTARQTDNQTNKQTDKQTNRQTNTLTFQPTPPISRKIGNFGKIAKFDSIKWINFPVDSQFSLCRGSQIQNTRRPWNVGNFRELSGENLSVGKFLDFVCL